MIDIGVLLLLLSVLLLLAAGAQPLALSLRLPPSVLLAAVGMAIGSLAWLLLGQEHAGAKAAQALLSLPLHSTTFLYGFLPPLLFQAALTLDIRRMLDDAAPILLLAVVAVVVATGVVGWSLSLLTGTSIIVCMLLGAIIATTDPAAVIAIFRDIGAPARLTRLVEGESLLNDAAAIALFTVLLGLLTGSAEGGAWAVVQTFFASFLGGILLGVVVGRVLIACVPLLRDISAAEFTLTLAAPWLAFILGERLFGVSGVVAVVAAAITFAALGPGRFTPANWLHLQRIWEQVAVIAGSLVFMLAAVLVPRLVLGVTWQEVTWVVAVVVAALVARALVLFGLLPLLSAVGLSERVGVSFKLVILWGGLRGAVTLALALAVTENTLLEPEVKRFVAVLATGFVLFTLFVNGVTLRPLMRLLHLDRLSPVNQALRDEVLALALVEVAEEVRRAGRDFAIAEETVAQVTTAYAIRADVPTEQLGDRDRLNLALLALAHRERELVLAHHERGAMPTAVVAQLLRHAGRLFDGGRTAGRHGYASAGRRALEFTRGFRFAYALHRHLGVHRLLADRLEERFALLLVSRLVLTDLLRFADRKLKPLLGERVAQVAGEVLAVRQGAVEQGLDALRLQYPDYAEALEQRHLAQLALAEEARHYDGLRDDGLIGEELHDHLRQGIRERRRDHALPELDLGLDTLELMEDVPLFAPLGDRDMEEIAGMLTPRFALPGERIVRRGDLPDGMYFISSGAVEVRLHGQNVLLGRGDFFGELALFNRKRRSADVVSLGYCHLLRLPNDEFSDFLDTHPALREQLQQVAKSRRGS